MLNNTSLYGLNTVLQININGFIYLFAGLLKFLASYEMHSKTYWFASSHFLHRHCTYFRKEGIPTHSKYLVLSSIETKVETTKSCRLNLAAALINALIKLTVEFVDQ